MNKLKILLNGIIKENPVLVLMLGTCPALATSTSVENAIGMGFAATFVLLGSNIVIAILKNIIPDKVRIPCFIVVIATFVTLVSMLLEAFYPPLYSALGIFLPLIVVNCIILGRAEMFASKNPVLNSALDGIGMGLGFTVALVFIASVREIIGSGSWLGIELYSAVDPMSLFTLAPGGFFVYGCMVALMNAVTKGKIAKKRKNACMACPSAAICNANKEGECEA